MESSGIRQHGEMAIAKAQLGQRQTDVGYKIGISLWFVLALSAGLFSLRGGVDGFSQLEFWALQVCGLVVSVAVIYAVQKSVAKKRQQQQEDFRNEAAARKQRELDEFMKSKNT